MSIEAERLAWRFVEARRPTAAQTVVLQRLAWRHNKNTGRCDPSLSTLVKETGLSRSTVVSALRWLAAHGPVDRVVRSREGLRGGRRSDQWDFDLEGVLLRPSTGHESPGARPSLQPSESSLSTSESLIPDSESPGARPERNGERNGLTENGQVRRKVGEPHTSEVVGL